MSIFKKQKTINVHKAFWAGGGYTILEMVIYVALVSVVALFVFNFIMLISNNSRSIIALDKISSEAVNSMEIMEYHIKNSEYVYLPTTNFENYNYNPAKANQLSLATRTNISSPENISYIDFYLEGGTLFSKEEGSSPIAITSSYVSISDMDFYYYKNDQRESVRIRLVVKPKNSSISNLSISLDDVIAFRSSN